MRVCIICLHYFWKFALFLKLNLSLLEKLPIQLKWNKYTMYNVTWPENDFIETRSNPAKICAELARKKCNWFNFIWHTNRENRLSDVWFSFLRTVFQYFSSIFVLDLRTKNWFSVSFRLVKQILNFHNLCDLLKTNFFPATKKC